MEFKLTQVYGKIIPLSEAENLFGEVKTSFSFTSMKLIALCSQTESVIMFGVNNGTMVITGKTRKVLEPIGAILPLDLIMHVFHITKVEELLNLGKGNITEIEIRNEVLDLKNGELVLEFGLPCPPDCG